MILYGVLQVILCQIPNFNKLWFLSIIAATMSFTYATLGVGLSIAKVAGIVLSYTLPLFSIIGRLYGISTSNTKPIAVILLALYIELQISYFMSSLVCWNLKLMRNNPWEISRKWSDSWHSGWNHHSQLRYSSPKSLEDITSSWWHCISISLFSTCPWNPGIAETLTFFVLYESFGRQEAAQKTIWLIPMNNSAGYPEVSSPWK